MQIIGEFGVGHRGTQGGSVCQLFRLLQEENNAHRDAIRVNRSTLSHSNSVNY